MQHPLIPVYQTTIGPESLSTVNARELHAFLRVGRDFATWIKDRIEKYGFVEGEDYAVYCSPDLGSRENQGLISGANRLDYYLAIDMAKELAMVENNPQGRQARRYFIAIEKQARVQAIELEAMRRALLAAHPTWEKILRCKRASLTNAETGRVINRSEKSVRRQLRTMRACGFVPPVARPSDAQLDLFAGEVVSCA